MPRHGSCRLPSFLSPGGLATSTLALAALLCSPTARGEIQPLSLYQRVGRAPWVIVGEVVPGEGKLAHLKVVEVLKGSYEGATLRVAYKLQNFLRDSWEEKVEFRAGDLSVLFLERYQSDRKDGKIPEELQAPDVFTPTFGAQGKFRLPEEGRPAYLDALREFVRLIGIEDPAAQEAALLVCVASPNPHVAQACLEQTYERRLAGEAQASVLMQLTDSPRDPIRLMALQVLGQVAEDLRAAGRVLSDQQDVVNRLKAKVLGEGRDVYRAEAMKVVAALAGAAERAFIERVSKEDPSQLVRYEASRALLALEGS